MCGWQLLRRCPSLTQAQSFASQPVHSISVLSASILLCLLRPPAFNRFRQNQGYDPVTLQTYEVTENLKLAFKPSLVLPLLSATRPLLLPQTNRYIEVCQPGTFRGPDAFVPCTACPTGKFMHGLGRACSVHGRLVRPVAD